MKRFKTINTAMKNYLKYYYYENKLYFFKFYYTNISK